MMTSRIGRLHQGFLVAALLVFLLAGWRGSAVEASGTNAATVPPSHKDLPARPEAKPAPDGHRSLPGTRKGLRGVFFHPQVKQSESPEFPWLLLYPQCRSEVRTHLKELVTTTDINFVSVFVNIAHSLKQPSQSPQVGQPLTAWANTTYLDNVAAFIDDCHTAGVRVEIDLACNLWVPRSVEPKHQIAYSGKWPMPSESPWNEAALWYRETITYLEGHTRHPERIAMWCMMGNYEFGEAEPCLWDRDDNPAIAASAEKFVKYVWPSFRSAGKRPKAPPIMLPILSNTSFWMARSPKARLSAFANLKKWIVDDLALPPDYWVMTTYPYCDPAPDGFFYLRAIMEILGPENAGRIVSTDLKGAGHDQELRDSIIIPPGGQTGADMLKWHFQKSAQYGFAGWWIWAYQDTPKATTGIRDLAGNWKQDLVQVIKQQAP
jgi:hypothetical protein